jgi:hypothetical protein
MRSNTCSRGEFLEPQLFIFNPVFKSLKLSSICMRVAYIFTTFFDKYRVLFKEVASNHGSFSRSAQALDFLLCQQSPSQVTLPV